jgi:heme A synthase
MTTSGQDRARHGRNGTPMNLPEWHAWPVLLVLTLAGDALCIALAAFGDVTGRTRMPYVFWWVLWLAQIPLGLQIALGLALYAQGARPRTDLHFMYGGLIILTLAALFALRPGSALRRGLIQDEAAFRESRWAAVLCLFLAGLVGRIYMTGAIGH